MSRRGQSAAGPVSVRRPAATALWVAKASALGLATAALFYGGILAAGSVVARLVVPHERCPAVGTLVQVDTSAHVLSLCRNGREEGFFRVALGEGGVDKRVEGDMRTPRGRYPLSRARASADYHLFLA